MARGAYRELVLRMDVDQVAEKVARALEAAGFTRVERQHIPDGISLRAVWGSKLKAFLLSLVPFGKYLRAGKRLGAEVEVVKRGRDALLRLLVVPYMELFDRPEIFLITQDIVEKLTDDSFSREKLLEVLLHLDRGQ